MSNDSADAVLAVRLKLLENGFDPIPLLGKQATIKGWSQGEMTAARVRQMHKDYPNMTNTGIRCAGKLGVDVDVPVEDLAADIEWEMEVRFGLSPLKRVGNAPKFLSLYVADDKTTRKTKTSAYLIDGKKCQVEILACGQQFAAAGTHPDTGKAYAWPESNPSRLVAGDLPVVKDADRIDFLKWCDALLASRGTAIDSVRANFGEPRTTADAARRATPITLDDLESALQTIPVSEDYDTWIAVGQAAFHSCDGSDEGLFLWNTWSSAAPNYDEGACLAKWDTFSTTAETKRRFGTLAKMAKEADPKWQPPSKLATTAALKIRHDDDFVAPEVLGDRALVRYVPEQITAVVRAAERALVKANLGAVRFGGAPHRVAAATTRDEADGRLTEVFTIKELTEPYLVSLFTDAANWEKYNGNVGEYVPCACPSDVAKTYLSWGEQGSRLPILEAIITSPTIRGDGSLLQEPGYDARTGLFFDPRGVTFPAIKEEPTREDALEAIQLIDGLFSEFPFKDGSTGLHRSVALAAVLCGLIRGTLDAAPAFIFGAPSASTGKSYMMSLITFLALGIPPTSINYTDDEKENTKNFDSLLLEGARAIFCDNVDDPIGGSRLASMMTEPKLKVRKLGESYTPTVPCRALVLFTANNPVIMGDVERRVLTCLMDAKMEFPGQRSFRNDPLKAVKADRGRYVAAGLTVLRAFEHANRPGADKIKPFASYDAFSSRVRAALMWLGYPDVMDVLPEVRAENPKREALDTMVSNWLRVFGFAKIPVREVIEKTLNDAALRDAVMAVASVRGYVDQQRLGNWLGRNRNVPVLDDVSFSRTLYNGTNRWGLSAGPISLSNNVAVRKAATAEAEAKVVGLDGQAFAQSA